MRGQLKVFIGIMAILILTIAAVSGAETSRVASNGVSQIVQQNIAGVLAPKVVVEEKTVAPGSTFDYPVMVYNAEDLANMDLDVWFGNNCQNIDYLKCTDVKKGSFIGPALFDYQYAPQQIGDSCFQITHISFASSSGVSGSGPVATFTCTLSKSPDLGFHTTVGVKTASTSTGKDISITTVEGYIIGGSTGKGDCDGDSYVSTKDALMAIQMATGKVQVNMACDMNGDGAVNSADAREILKLAQTGGTGGATGQLAGPGTGQAGAGSGLGQPNQASGGEFTPIPIPRPLNRGQGSSGTDDISATPITIPRVWHTGYDIGPKGKNSCSTTDKTGCMPIPIP
jgi:hypothetical protein